MFRYKAVQAWESVPSHFKSLTEPALRKQYKAFLLSSVCVLPCLVLCFLSEGSIKVLDRSEKRIYMVIDLFNFKGLISVFLKIERSDISRKKKNKTNKQTLKNDMILQRASLTVFENKLQIRKWC